MNTTTLRKKEWTLLAIALAEGKPLSPVQLQKSVFLFGKLLPDEVLPEDFYEFVPYNYGPFCSEVYRDAEELAEEGLVQISSEATHGYAQYSATPEGVAESRRLIEVLPSDAADHARVVVEWVREQTFRGLVSAIYERYPEYRANSVFAGWLVTVIVGIRCRDAVVLGADSMATYATTLGQETINQQTEKQYVIGEDAILGVSGSVSMGQSYYQELFSKAKGTGNRTRYKDIAYAKKELGKALWKHAGPAWERAAVAAKTIGANNAYREVAHDTLTALPVNDGPCLLGFTQQCEATEYDANLPIVSIGSGQAVADPFLAFIHRIFWPDSLPTLSEGVLAAVWALTHTIQSQPAHVGEPIQVVTVSKDQKGQWKAQELPDSDLGEHREHIRAMEERMRTEVKEAFSEKPTSPLPAEKKSR